MVRANGLNHWPPIPLMKPIGTNTTTIDIVKSQGYSTTAVADVIRGRVADIQRTLPVGVSLRVVRDAGVRVSNAVRSVQEALLEGAFLTVIVVFLFLN